MKKHTSILLISLLLCSCGTNKNDPFNLDYKGKYNHYTKEEIKDKLNLFHANGIENDIAHNHLTTKQEKNNESNIVINENFIANIEETSAEITYKPLETYGRLAFFDLNNYSSQVIHYINTLQCIVGDFERKEYPNDKYIQKENNENGIKKVDNIFYGTIAPETIAIVNNNCEDHKEANVHQTFKGNTYGVVSKNEKGNDSLLYIHYRDYYFADIVGGKEETNSKAIEIEYVRYINNESLSYISFASYDYKNPNQNLVCAQIIDIRKNNEGKWCLGTLTFGNTLNLYKLSGYYLQEINDGYVRLNFDKSINKNSNPEVKNIKIKFNENYDYFGINGECISLSKDLFSSISLNVLDGWGNKFMIRKTDNSKFSHYDRYISTYETYIEKGTVTAYYMYLSGLQSLLNADMAIYQFEGENGPMQINKNSADGFISCGQIKSYMEYEYDDNQLPIYELTKSISAYMTPSICFYSDSVQSYEDIIDRLSTYNITLKGRYNLDFYKNYIYLSNNNPEYYFPEKYSYGYLSINSLNELDGCGNKIIKEITTYMNKITKRLPNIQKL